MFNILSTACQHDIIIRDESIFVLSEERATYWQAKESCQSKGSELAQVTKSNRIFFNETVRKKYLSTGNKYIESNIK